MICLIPLDRESDTNAARASAIIFVAGAVGLKGRLSSRVCVLDHDRPTGHIVIMLKQNHRDKILHAALSVFHERGFHDTGTQDIVDLAGVSKGSFYNHFKSKDLLGLAVLDLYWESYAKSTRLLNVPERPALKRIEDYFKSISYDEKGCLVGNFSTELSSSDLFRERISKLFDVWTAEMANCISDGQKDGTIRNNQSAETLAEFVISSFEGAIMRAKIERDPSVLERFRTTTLAFLKSG